MQTGPILAVALLGGFAAGTVGGLLFAPSGPNDSNDPLLASAEGGSGEYESLQKKYSALAGENASLRASLDDLSRTVDSLANRRQAVPTATPEVVNKAQDSYADQAAVPYTLEEEMRFSAYIDNLEKKKEEEREAEREERRVEQLARRVDRLSEELGLDTFQKGEMQRVLTESETATRDYFGAMRESGSFDRDAMRQGMADLNQKTTDSLAGFLNPAQLEQYQSSNNGLQRFFGGDAAGGGRGGNRGGGGDANGTRGGGAGFGGLGGGNTGGGATGGGGRGGF
jgi:hypothetical protein